MLYLSLCRTEKRTGMLLRGIDFLGWRAGRLSNRGSFSNRKKIVHKGSAVCPEHEGNHCLPYSSEIKNEWSYSSTPRRHLRSIYRDNFIFFVFVFFFFLFLSSFNASGNLTIIYALSCVSHYIPNTHTVYQFSRY
jgi:hypothetical protein